MIICKKLPDNVQTAIDDIDTINAELGTINAELDLKLEASDLLAALEAVASDIPESDPIAPDRIWLDGGLFRFTGTTGLVGDLLVGTAFVS